MEILSAKMLRVKEDKTLIYDYEFSGDSWQEQQSIDKALDCLYSPSHKLL